jgi:GNAT superfamily N-acetyltransferase
MAEWTTAEAATAGGTRAERWDPADTGTALACYEVFRAAHLTDEPLEPPKSAGTFRVMLTEGWDGNPGEVWAVRGEATGTAVAYYRLDLPDLENRDRAFAHLVVHPAVRRHGIGRELVRHAARRAAASERSILDGVVLEGSAGDAFAQRIGAALSLEEVRRVQDLRKVPPGRVAGLRATAARAAAGYSLVTWTGPIPDQYAGQVAELFNAFNDAPHGEGVEEEFWDADRIRERTGSILRAGHMRGYTVAAVHGASGEMAAFTAMLVGPEHPEWAYQQLTAVTRPHRGHRLGLLVKTAMLEWLAEAEPAVRWVATGNAAANEHMIAVNETLGYEVVKPGYRFYELAVAAAARRSVR